MASAPHDLCRDHCALVLLQVAGASIQGAADMLKKFLHHVERTLPSYFQWRFESAIGTVGQESCVEES